MTAKIRPPYKVSLRDLEARFIRMRDDSIDGWIELGDESARAQGVAMLCPKCFRVNGGPIGTHTILCWFVGVPPGVDPGPGRWIPNPRATIENLTFIGPAAGSYRATGHLHGFVRKGFFEVDQHH